ncbi:MAG TPA: hypothetical protein VFT66_03595 [Roseiflexaceae bacterium]|jgi:hypothetical protein|nr:hypothetical protein [Roseiflexaceae bacterium]
MSQTVTISDNLYKRLKTEAQRHRLNSVEDLLELWASSDSNEVQRRKTVHAIRMFRERMQTNYGEAPDSVELLRTDRMR